MKTITSNKIFYMGDTVEKFGKVWSLNGFKVPVGAKLTVKSIDGKEMILMYYIPEWGALQTVSRLPYDGDTIHVRKCSNLANIAKIVKQAENIVFKTLGIIAFIVGVCVVGSSMQPQNGLFFIGGIALIALGILTFAVKIGLKPKKITAWKFEIEFE